MGWFHSPAMLSLAPWRIILNRPHFPRSPHKPLAQGWLDFSRATASAVLIAAIALCLWLFPQRAGKAH